MRLLLDTQVVVWTFGLPQRLSKEARLLVTNPAHDVRVSSASVWEIAMKAASGRLKIVPEKLMASIADAGYRMLDISAEHGIAAARLPLVHRDPFDRILIAQATVEGLRIVTADYTFGKYEGDPIFV